VPTTRAPFVVEKEGPPGLFAVFEDDADTGYLYLYEPGGREIFRHLHVYDRTPRLTVSEPAIDVIWSEGNRKCGVMVRGQMMGIIDLENDREGRVWMESDDTPGIDDKEWLQGFQL
jgi:hypothetical protein